MAVNGRSKLTDVTLVDVAEEARAWPLDPSAAVSIAGGSAERILGAVAEIDVPEELRALVQKRATTFLLGRDGPGRPVRAWAGRG